MASRSACSGSPRNFGVRFPARVARSAPLGRGRFYELARRSVDTYARKIAFLRHPLSLGFYLSDFYVFNKGINLYRRRGNKNLKPSSSRCHRQPKFRLIRRNFPLKPSPAHPAVSSARAPTPSAYPLPARRTRFPPKGKETYIKYSSHFYLSFRKPEQPQHQKTFRLRRKDFCPTLQIRVA